MVSGGGRGSYQRAQRATRTPRTPKPAQARLDRFASTTSRTSLLTVPSAYGLRSAGFEAIGDVMGCIGTQFSHEYVGLCATVLPFRRSAAPARVVLGATTSSTRFSYARQLRGAYTSALDRLLSEARALGADGVLGIELSMQTHDDLREVVAVGTAVRSLGRTHPARPFTTDLPGTDVAALLLGGWVPVGLHAAVQVGVRHNDYATLTQAGSGISKRQPNQEVTGWSDLLQRTQHSAADLMRMAATAAGADGALLSSLRTTHWHKECVRRAGQGSDQVACTVAIGTSIARIGGRRADAPAPLTILPVGAR